MIGTRKILLQRYVCCVEFDMIDLSLTVLFIFC
jgi:hypothetical protein